MPKRSRQPKTGKRRLDIRDVARHARVSIATVSRTINRLPTVDKTLAERVWKSIAELNYFPNTQARALVSGHSRLFGLLISEITNPFFPELIQGFEEVAVENGYEILIGSTNYDPERMAGCVRRMMERNVEGVAVMTFGMEEPLLEELASRGIPMVFVDAGPPGEMISALVVDYKSGILQAVNHLAGLGHRRIGFVNGPLHQRSAALRRTAFQRAVNEAGLTVRSSWLFEGDHTLEGGMKAAEQWLARAAVHADDAPTAILCSNDMTAIGALRTFHHAGVSVPGDISVVGFDDIHMAEFVYPPLTTVRMSRTDLARAAFEALRTHVEKLEDGRRAAWQVPTGLIVRKSTAAPPRAEAIRRNKPRKQGRAASSSSD